MGRRTSSQLIGSYSKYANAGKGRQGQTRTDRTGKPGQAERVMEWQSRQDRQAGAGRASQRGRADGQTEQTGQAEQTE